MAFEKPGACIRAFCGILILPLFCLGLLAGCAGRRGDPAESEGPDSTPPVLQQEETSSSSPVETLPPQPEETAPAEETPLPTPEEPVVLSDREALKGELITAMEGLRQPWVMDISDLGLETPELDVKNIYYEITAEHPELKYVYDLTAEARGNELACELSFMPYKTGEFPEDFSGEEAASLRELLAVAEAHLGEAEVPIRITDTTLDPDQMNRALQQVGSGYLYCALNRDATVLQYSAPAGMTLEACLEALELADDLADQVTAQVVTPEMTERERAKALYAYLTVNVTYDQRYYSDRVNMPYESQTAVGALRDQTAICGGYANALKLLYEKIGIPCYTVSGKYFQENHMWNVALLDGQWLWFDATIDRGNTGEFGFLRFALTELDGTKYQYRQEDVQALTVP